jgi:hypothetical protein
VVVAVLAVAGALGGLLAAQSVLAGQDLMDLVCTAAENLPCRPLTLECLFAAAGGAAAGLPAIPPSYRETPDPRASRDYAPEPPPGYQPPPRQSPQDALSDEDFRQAREDWARDNADRVYPTPPAERTRGQSAADVLVQSIRHSGSRR